MENKDCNLILKNYYNYNAATNLKLELKAQLYSYENIYNIHLDDITKILNNNKYKNNINNNN